MRPELRPLAFGFLALFLTIAAQSGFCQAPSTTTPGGVTPPQATAATPYKESAARRFEIITLVSLPFTAMHSYLVFRGVKMVRQGDVAAAPRGSDWNVIGIGAAAFSLGIATYDWARMRGKDRSEPLLPTPPPTPDSTLEPTSGGQGWSLPFASLRLRF